jgi:hypothetical protein
MAQTLNFKTKQELDAYLAQNPQVKGTIQGFGMDGQKVAPQKDFISSLIGGIVDPFLGLGQKTLEAGASIGQGLAGGPGLDKFLTGSKDYKTTFMNSDEYENFAKNPLLATVKDVAGVGATFIPIGKVGQGIGALAKNSAIASGLSSFANQDKENTGNINLGQIGTDALLGGALGGGIGVLQKGLPFGKGTSKLGQNLETAGTDIKSLNLGNKFNNDIPFEQQLASNRQAVNMLDEAKLPVSPMNAQKLAKQNTANFRNELSQVGGKVDFGGTPTNSLTANLQDLSQELDNTAVNSLTTQKNLRPSVIKNQLANDPLSSDLASQISGLEDIIKETRPPAGFNTKLKQVISALENKTNVSNKVTNVDNLASDLFNSLPGGQTYLQKLDDGFSPEDVIQEFLTDRNKLKTQLNNTYETAHQNLIKANPDYAKKYGQTAETLFIPSQVQGRNNIAQGIQDKLYSKFNLSPEELQASPVLQNKLNTVVSKLTETNGEPEKVFDLISFLTTDKGWSDGLLLSDRNKIIEGTRKFAQDSLGQLNKNSKAYFQNNAILNDVTDNSAQYLNSLNNVPLPFVGGQVAIPGIGAVKQGVTSATGGALQGIGRFLQNGIGGVGNIADIANGRIGQTLQRGLPFAIGSQAFNQPQQAGMEQATTDTSQTQTSQATNPAQDPEVRAVLQQLMTPTKQGGQGLSPSEAEKYMKITYGIDVGSGNTGKTTDAQRKYLAASDLAKNALKLLESGKVGTGKVATAGNFISQLLGNQSETQTDYNSKLASARGSAISALSGANVPESEYARIADLIPVSTDEPQIAKQKLKSFVEAMNSYANAGT